ncbi:hypothetical protein [Paenibacillus sp. 1-18]|uniref:hypothetical protein n=1 Tax=Paenibacillus sp. 1-18 TaxID=1333846 RepID=UPI0012DF5AD3|nr:hypothetical protein [Paenibacillus sp. 1-18]
MVETGFWTYSNRYPLIILVYHIWSDVHEPKACPLLLYGSRGQALGVSRSVQGSRIEIYLHGVAMSS